MSTSISSSTPENEILSSLINPDRLRSSIKRLFRNSIHEALSELFQNSQRAGAKHVRITTNNEGFSYFDDGHGLLNGVTGFHTLLRLVDSHFANDTIESQHPMGLGVHSLLSMEQITEVTFISGQYRLAIDCTRWSEDKEYYETWFERLETIATPISQGILIDVRCSEALRTSLSVALDPARQVSHIGTPAQGYKETLSILLDNQPVDTGLPAWATPQAIVTTTYQQSSLIIGFSQDDFCRRSVVNFYGQLIPVQHNGPFSFYLEVFSGRPVNPLSPSRQGIITYSAFYDLLAFIDDVGPVIK